MLATQKLIQQTEEFVKSALAEEPSGHDWWHIERVRRLAVSIAPEEDADLFIVELASLVHELDDYKLTTGNPEGAPLKARAWLKYINVDGQTTDHVCNIIRGISFKGQPIRSISLTREGMVVQDADRLDAMGAIGIARTFTYGGRKGRKIYEPSVQPRSFQSFEEYQKNTSPTINHFYEKLLLLKDLMNTTTGKRLAEQRHRFMQSFLNQFHSEWNEATSKGFKSFAAR